MDIATEIERQAFTLNPLAWFDRNYARIMRKEVGADPDKPVEANWLQLRLGEAVKYCIANDLPIRIITYKVRQVGSSSGSSAIMYTMCRLYPMRCMMIGTEYSETDRVWSYLKHYGEMDKFAWGNIWELNQKNAKCSNGTTWERETAEDPNAGRAAGAHCLLVTELAQWPTDGEKNAASVLTSLESSLAKGPRTIEIIESTARGPVGPFPEKWADAVTLEEMQSGIRGNGFIKIFAPWFVFDEYRTPLETNDKRTLLTKIANAGDKEAVEVHHRYNLDLEQTKWFHETAWVNCQKDNVKRNQEYPSCPEDGFAASMPGLFSKDGLSYLEGMAKAAVRGAPYVIGKRDGQDILSESHKLCFGNLHTPEGATHPVISPCEPGYTKDYKRCVDPSCNIVYLNSLAFLQKVGCKHIIGTDNSQGRQNALGSKVDKNAVILLRDNYIDASTGLYMPPEPIATLAPGNEWEQDKLAVFVANLSTLLGRCMVAPEKNCGLWLIRELQRRGIPMIQTPRNPDKVDQEAGEDLLGWQTSNKSKPMLVAEMQHRVRQPKEAGSGIACRFPNIVEELRTFVQHPDGSTGALKVTNTYDDNAMAFMIAVMCKNAATTYALPIVQRPVPEDIQRIRGMMGKKSRFGL